MNMILLCDASIANIVSCSIVHVVLICVIGFLLWKLMDHIAHGISGFYKRKWEIEDIERKQKAELLEMERKSPITNSQK